MLHVGSSVLGGIGNKSFLLRVEVAVVSDERNEGAKMAKWPSNSNYLVNRPILKLFSFLAIRVCESRFWISKSSL